MSKLLVGFGLVVAACTFTPGAPVQAQAPSGADSAPSASYEAAPGATEEHRFRPDIRLGGLLVPGTLRLEPHLERRVLQVRRFRKASFGILGIAAASALGGGIWLGTCLDGRGYGYWGCTFPGLFGVGVPVTVASIAGIVAGRGRRHARGARSMLLLVHPELRGRSPSIGFSLSGRCG